FSSQIMSFILHFIFLVTFICPIYSLETSNHQVNQTLRFERESQKLNKTIKTLLQQINKPAIKTIQSPDGDIIDCVLFHKQPAFDLPVLKGQISLDSQENSEGHDQINNNSTLNFQPWHLSGEFCPNGTIPIRRTKEEEIQFGRKSIPFHERLYEVVTYVQGAGYHGAKGTINVWSPRVENNEESSSSKIWVQSLTAKESIEAGWQVCPKRFGDSRPRIFTYWTVDAYKGTGCYNLQCPGFVQTSRKVVPGTVVAPVSIIGGDQYDFNLKFEQDQKNQRWWLEYGAGNENYERVGYWPFSLFKELNHEANLIQFGGEVVDLNPTGDHTSTYMGSGQFAQELAFKAAYIKSMKVAINPYSYIDLLDNENIEATPDCYSIVGGFNKNYESYIFFGGPGRNPKCP
ncbi:hypothetical protein RYX36_025131, partial [Vicia faba]